VAAERRAEQADARAQAAVDRADRIEEQARAERAGLERELGEQRDARQAAELEQGRAQAALDAEQRLVSSTASGRVLGSRASARPAADQGCDRLRAVWAPGRLRQPARRHARPTWTYTYQCVQCGREFEHTKPGVTLRAHKDSYGYPCHGRRGTLVDQSWH
jgi:hypothetical protein